MRALVFFPLLLVLLSGGCTGSRTYQPKFIATPPRLSIFRENDDNPVPGGHLHRRCEWSSPPTTGPWRYSWKHSDGKWSTGQILNVDLLHDSQMGKYMCVAEAPNVTEFAFIYVNSERQNPVDGANQSPPERNELSIRTLFGERLVTNGVLLRRCDPPSSNYDVYWILPGGKRIDSRYLTIRNLRWQDSGYYYCYAKNRISGASLKKWFPVILPSPPASARIQMNKIVENGVESWHCSVNQRGWDISWMYPNGRTIRGEYVRMNNASRHDVMYTCIARNRKTNQEMRQSLVQKARYYPIDIVQIPPLRQ